MSKDTYDVIVIGGGPGGYVTAIRCAQLGLSTLCVEKEYMGGVCLNWGCIPSKALISATGLADKVKHAAVMGLDVQGLSMDVGKLQQWKESIVKKLTSGVTSLVKGNGGEVAMGAAKLTGPKSVEIDDGKGGKRTVKANRGIVIATGAQVINIPGFEPDGKTVITAREAVSLKEAPKSMVLIGGGVIGLELGMVYQKLGTKLTIVEMQGQLLPGVDPELVKVVERKVKKGGADILVNAQAKSLALDGGKATVQVNHDGVSKAIETEKVLVAVGFKPNSTNLGLEAVGVKTDDRGHIIADNEFKTNVEGVFAIGDVCGAPYLAHKASKEGEVVAEILAGKPAAKDWLGMPAAIFTDPEIATVGLTESEAKSQGLDVKIGKFPFSASGRAMSVLETDGFVKTVIDASDNRLLGVHIVGPDASDLISEAALAVEMCAFAEDVALTVHPHPTLGEAMMESFKHSLKEAVHIMNR